MIRITQLKLSINHTPEELSQKIRKELRLKNEGLHLRNSEAVTGLPA